MITNQQITAASRDPKRDDCPINLARISNLIIQDRCRKRKKQFVLRTVIFRYRSVTLGWVFSSKSKSVVCICKRQEYEVNSRNFPRFPEGRCKSSDCLEREK